MNPTEFGDGFSPGTTIWLMVGFLVKYFNSYWMDWHESYPQDKLNYFSEPLTLFWNQIPLKLTYHLNGKC